MFVILFPSTTFWYNNLLHVALIPTTSVTLTSIPSRPPTIMPSIWSPRLTSYTKRAMKGVQRCFRWVCTEGLSADLPELLVCESFSSTSKSTTAYGLLPEKRSQITGPKCTLTTVISRCKINNGCMHWSQGLLGLNMTFHGPCIIKIMVWDDISHIWSYAYDLYKILIIPDMAEWNHTWIITKQGLKINMPTRKQPYLYHTTYILKKLLQLLVGPRKIVKRNFRREWLFSTIVGGKSVIKIRREELI